MKSIVIIFAAFILIIATPTAFAFIDDANTDSTTETTSGVAVSGNYSTNLTMGRAIFNNDVTSITSITSNASTDSPEAYAYNSVSRVLTVSGLDDAETTRTLAVIFNIDATGIPTGMDTLFTLLRWFWIFMIVGFTCGAVYAFFVT